MPENAIDPAACPECRGRLKVLKARRSAGGVVTRYRECECGTRTVDRTREVVTLLGKPRVVKPSEKVVYQNGTHFGESEAATVPTSTAPG